jgi:hypothetical protein
MVCKFHTIQDRPFFSFLYEIRLAAGRLHFRTFPFIYLFVLFIQTLNNSEDVVLNDRVINKT